MMFPTKKGYMHHPVVIGFIIGFILGLAVIYALNKGLIPGVGLKIFC